MTDRSAISSMTGFAQSAGQTDTVSWTWELRSVNARGLDIRFRLPAGSESLEAPARNKASARFSRGTLSISLTLQRSGPGGQASVNRDLLEEIFALHEEYGARIDPSPPRLENLLAIRGVLEIGDEGERLLDDSAARAAVLAGLDVGLAALDDARREEGARLADIVGGHVSAIADQVARAGEMAETLPDAIRVRFKEHVSELMAADPALPEERLAQEAALLASKSDVREELDRLGAHVAAAQELLAGGGAVGRRLDFLCQEFNREANTLCAKAATLELNSLGLDLKSTIAQLKEQIQNIE